MRDSLFSLRGFGSGEKNMVSMLLAQALLLGIFIGAFDISAHSLFLAIFDEKMLAKGYIASGIAGIILLSSYFFLQANVKLRNFAFLNLIIVAIITLILWMLLLNHPSKWMIFLVFIMLGPLNIISVIGFRTSAGAIFAGSKGRRLFAMMDSVLIVGVILICYTIPVILSFGFSLHNILLISAIAVFVSGVVQGMAGVRMKLATENVNNQPVGFRSTLSVLSVFRHDNYTRILGLFIILSVVSAFFIQYSFLAVTREKFPAAGEMAQFLGIFTGSIMLLTLLGKLLLFSYLLKNYGLKVCLTISPVLLLIFTAIAVAFGMLMGYTKETASGFMIFFILLALIRFLSKSLDDSVESPSFRVLYQTIDEKLRFGMQSVIDSAVKEASAFLAGLILAGIGILGFIRLIHFSWVLVIILIAWLAVAFRLYAEYRKSIEKGLESLNPEEITEHKSGEPVIFHRRFYGERAFRLDYFNLVSGDLSLFEKTDNRFYFSKILEQAVSKHDFTLLPLVKKMAVKSYDEDIRFRSAEIAENFETWTESEVSDDEKVITAKRVLSETRMPQTTEILRLLRDKKIESKKLAIYMIGKFRISDMLPEVCECLNVPGLEMDTATVLSAFGNIAEEQLIRFYLLSSGNINTSKTILRLLSGIPLNEGTGFLFSRLWSNSRQLKEVAVKGLLDCHFKPTEEDKERLKMLISDVVGTMTWTLSAKRCLEKNNDPTLLKEIEKELDRWSRFLINILSITYNAAAVTRIRKNLEVETIESVYYAHAIIDIIADDSIKAKIIYLLDVIPDDEKLRNLNRFFPVGISDYNKLLEEILNRDYNLLSIWTKACVLRYLPLIRDTEMAESVVALLFSPESLLQEEAVRLIARSDIKLYKSVYNRISVPTRKHLDRVVNGESDTKEFLFDKIRFLASIFNEILEEELMILAKSMIFSADLGKLQSAPSDGFILWSLPAENAAASARVFFPSSVGEANDTIAGTGSSSVYILSFKAIDEFLYQFPDTSEIILEYLENNEG